MTPHRAGERPNPEPCEGSLIWWVYAPTGEQNYLQGLKKDEHGELVSLACLDSLIDAKVLLDIFRQEINLQIPDSAPSFTPAEQPQP